MSQWVRLWEDMPNDPKWRVVAKRSGRPITEVLSVFVHMLKVAGAASDRGTLESWIDEDISAALDMEPQHVEAIREAMQGKTLDGDRLTGWDKRQPKREDGAAERAKQWRERHKPVLERNRTQPNATDTLANAPEPPEEKREDTEKKESKKERAENGFKILDPDGALFEAGRKILGKTAGGQIVKLKAMFGGDVERARQFIDAASLKDDPAEYVAATIRKHSKTIPAEQSPTRVWAQTA